MAGPPPAVAAAFLTDGGQSAESVAQRLAAFLGAARVSLDIAIYDLALREGPARVLETAIRAVLARGVEVRLLFNVDHALTPAVPPPPAVDEDLVRRLGIPFRAVSGVPDLMHHKYVVRDAGTPAAAVLTGSTNWTNDSWTREENVIVTVDSDAVAAAYRFDFEELWTTREVAASGHQATGWSPLPGGAEGERVRPHFTPGHAHRLVHAIARRIHAARRRIRICSPVITSGPVLGTLAELLEAVPAGLTIGGAFDATQMREVMAQWAENGTAGWKMEAFRSIVGSGLFSAKASTPYGEGTVHDFMHAKLTVLDDRVFVGSFNLSHSGESNAENVLEIEHAPLADLCADFVDLVAARYPKASSRGD